MSGDFSSFDESDGLTFKSPRNTFISLVLVLLVLGGVGVGSLLTMRNQNLNEKAAGGVVNQKTSCADNLFIMVSSDGKNPSLNLKPESGATSVYLHTFTKANPCAGSMEVLVNGSTTTLQTDQNGVGKINIGSSSTVTLKAKVSNASVWSNEITLSRLP